MGLDEPAALRRGLRKSRIVVNCAGPYLDTGTRLLEAALDARVTYLDLAGEASHIERIYKEWDRIAKSKGVAVCPGFAAIGTLGDWGAHIIARTLASHLGADSIDALTVTYAHSLLEFFRPSIGSALSAASQYFLSQQTSELMRSVEFPPPFGAGSALKIPGGEEVSIQRHLPIESVRTYIAIDPGGSGNDPINRALAMGHRWLPWLGRIMMSDWGRWHLKFYLPSPENHHPRHSFGALIEGSHSNKAKAVLGITTLDSYIATASIVGMAIEFLLRRRPAVSGVLAPSQLIDPYAAMSVLQDANTIRIYQPVRDDHIR